MWNIIVSTLQVVSPFFSFRFKLVSLFSNFFQEDCALITIPTSTPTWLHVGDVPLLCSHTVTSISLIVLSLQCWVTYLCLSLSKNGAQERLCSPDNWVTQSMVLGTWQGLTVFKEKTWMKTSPKSFLSSEKSSHWIFVNKEASSYSEPIKFSFNQHFCSYPSIHLFHYQFLWLLMKKILTMGQRMVMF